MPGVASEKWNKVLKKSQNLILKRSKHKDLDMRKISLISGSRADYGIMKNLITKLQKDRGVKFNFYQLAVFYKINLEIILIR